MSAPFAPWGFDPRNPQNVPTVRDPFAANNPAPVDRSWGMPNIVGRLGMEGAAMLMLGGVLLVGVFAGRWSKGSR